MKLPKILKLLSACALLLPALSSAQSSKYTYLQKDNLLYVAYIPKENNMEPGELYPLVLYMHGSCGECTTHTRITWESNLQVWHNYNANTQIEPTFVIAPAGGSGGWTNANRRDTILSIIDEFVENHPIDPQRIYITGFSAGARGVWDYIQFRPNFFAAANPQAINPPAVNPELVRNTPIWATIGSSDTIPRVDGLKNTVAAIREANGDPRGPLTWEMGVNPRLTIFQGLGHGDAMEATQKMPGYLEWMYAQRLDGNHTPNIYFETPTEVRIIDALPAEVNFNLVVSDADGDDLDIEVRLDGEIITGPWTPSGPGGTHSAMVPITELGEYVLEATATDPSGRSASTKMILFTEITPVAAEILSLDATDESAILKWSGISGMKITIQQSADLLSWEPVTTTTATGEEESTSVDLPTEGTIFLRAVTTP